MTSPVTTWRYSVPSENEGWAVLFLDSSGVFASVSDWGSYSYHWHSSCWPQANGFREFIVGCNDDSLLGKLTRGEMIYDGEATAMAIKKHILSQRREGWLTAAEAKREWVLVAYENGVDSSEYDFGEWLSSTGLDDAREFMKSRPPPQAVSFIKRVIPRLREAIRVELEKESLTTNLDAWADVPEGTEPKPCSRCGGPRSLIPGSRIAACPGCTAQLTSVSFGVWCVEDRAWCHDTVGSRKYAEDALPRWQSGEAADVDPARFHYEVRPVVGREAEAAPGARAVEKFSKAERGGDALHAGVAAHDPSEEKRAEGGSPSVAKSDPGDSSASPLKRGGPT